MDGRGEERKGEGRGEGRRGEEGAAKVGFTVGSPASAWETGDIAWTGFEAS